MFRHGARSFATSAQRAAAAVAAAEPSQHLINVAKAQGIAKGLTGGKTPHLRLKRTTT
jgi:cysteine synthase A